MKRFTLLFYMSLMVVSFLAASNGILHERTENPSNVKSRNQVELVFWEETFEDGLGEWQLVDETDTPTDHNWHLTNNPFFTYGETGYSWWMGDPAYGNNGGYSNGQLVYMQTPNVEITVANAMLTFDANWRVEPPAFYYPYGSWDGWHVRISTNGGMSWSVLTNPTPAYNSTNIYAFSYHNEPGLNPGWSGFSYGWSNISFNLINYVGQNVIIRWVFGSDHMACTNDEEGDPDWWGVVIDNISVGGTTYNFNDGNEQGFTYGNAKVPSGQWWYVATDPTAPAPGDQVMRNGDPETGQYVPNVFNYLYSPIITMPTAGAIKVDFMIKGNWYDQGHNDAIDFEVSPDAGTTWFPIYDPYGNGGYPTYIRYITGPNGIPSWSWFSDCWAPDGFISGYAGLDMRFRILFYSNATGHNIGPFIDNFTIFQIFSLPPANHLSIELADGQVQLSWFDPIHSSEGEPSGNLPKGEHSAGLAETGKTDILGERARNMPEHTDRKSVV